MEYKYSNNLTFFITLKSLMKAYLGFVCNKKNMAFNKFLAKLIQAIASFGL